MHVLKGVAMSGKDVTRPKWPKKMPVYFLQLFSLATLNAQLVFTMCKFKDSYDDLTAVVKLLGSGKM